MAESKLNSATLHIAELGIDFELPIVNGQPVRSFGDSEFVYEPGFGFVSIGGRVVAPCTLRFIPRGVGREAEIVAGGTRWVFAGNRLDFVESDHGPGTGLLSRYYFNDRRLVRMESIQAGAVTFTVIYGSGQLEWQYDDRGAMMWTPTLTVEVAEKRPNTFRFRIDGVGEDVDVVKLYVTIGFGGAVCTVKCRGRGGNIYHL